MNAQKSYVIWAVIWSVVMSYVLRLSAPERGVIDWMVIGAVASAILWSLVALGRRLHGRGGQKALGHEARTAMFWLVGLMNTVWARPGAQGTWKWWVGAAFLALAVVDTVALFRKERHALASSG
jgi:hypothetical protein